MRTGALSAFRICAAFRELLRLTELGEVAAVEDEVGLGGERVHVVHRLEDGTHEALVQRLLVEVRVGDVGEAETLARGLDIHRLEGVGREGPADRGAGRGHPGRPHEVAAVQTLYALKVLVALLDVLLVSIFHGPYFLQLEAMRPISSDREGPGDWQRPRPDRSAIP